MPAKFKSYLKTMLKSVIFKNADGYIFKKTRVNRKEKAPLCRGFSINLSSIPEKVEWR